jgi:dimethylhistidine N-methyltransferase
MLDDVTPTRGSVVDEILDGLAQPQKTLPAKLFYDAEGCRLFGEITRLPEYYVTRAENALIENILPILPRVPGSALVEYGGSDESKAVVILDRVKASTYVPIDVADDALQAIKQRLATSRPALEVFPIAVDFLQAFKLPSAIASQPKIGFFPGSTIGNLDPVAARQFLKQARQTLGPDAAFIVGVDLRKDPRILVPAYDDAQGVTAAFNRNMLTHLNRLTDAGFDPLSFEHRVLWNAAQSRIEMHLVSMRSQTVQLAGRVIDFERGETIHTENSYKHSVDSFIELAGRASWASEAVWTDDAEMFSIHLLRAEGPSR